jgi:hypothetical protein
MKRIFSNPVSPIREDIDMRSIFGLCAALPLFCACIGSSVGTLKPTGELATIALCDTGEREGELLCLTDSSLCMMAEGKIVRLPFTSIETIHVQGFDGKSSKVGLGGLMILVDVLMLGASGNDSGQNSAPWVAAFGASAVLLGYSMFKEEQYGLFTKPFQGDSVERLKPFCRYPAGLNETQWKTLLEQHPSESTGPPSLKP